jgi:hypothetical protein
MYLLWEGGFSTEAGKWSVNFTKPGFRCLEECFISHNVEEEDEQALKGEAMKHSPNQGTGWYRILGVWLNESP